MDQRRLRAHYPNAICLAELYAEKADHKKAKSYYEEALKALGLIEPNAENEERGKMIAGRLAKL